MSAEPTSHPQRVTITEIAHRSGVSKSAVSYALNNRPGLSGETRQRILDVAQELGWTPNRTARLLSGSRTDSFGFVLSRPATILGSEPFFMHLIAGLQSVLAERQYALLLQLSGSVEEECETYRKWWAERRVDACIIIDARIDDPRIEVIRELGMPAVFVSDPSLTGGIPTVWADDAGAMLSAVGYLTGLGHTRLARVAGPQEFGATRIRDDAFETGVAEHRVHGQIVHAEFTGESGAAAVEQLMATRTPPTAIVFDNDLMAVAAVGALHQLGVAVPDDVSLLAWDDSELCALTRPQLSAVRNDVTEIGRQVARHLFGLLDGAAPSSLMASSATLVERGSTARRHHPATLRDVGSTVLQASASWTGPLTHGPEPTSRTVTEVRTPSGG